MSVFCRVCLAGFCLRTSCRFLNLKNFPLSLLLDIAGHILVFNRGSPAHLESYYVISCIELSLQYHLMRYTLNSDTYGINVTLPGNIHLAYKSLQLLDPLLRQKVSAQAYAVVALVCLPPTWEFVHH